MQSPNPHLPTLNVKRWLARVIWLLLPAILIALTIPRLKSGLSENSAFPVPTYMIMNVALPRQSYAQAAEILAHSDPNDGGVRIAAAEAAANAGSLPTRVVDLVRQGLEHSPVSARGWTLLAEQELRENNSRHGAQALSMALVLGPYDYWIAGRRARAGAALWNDLSPDDQRAVENQARLLWETPGLRTNLLTLLRVKNGPYVLTRAMGNDSQKIRTLNRWISQAEREQNAGTSP